MGKRPLRIAMIGYKFMAKAHSHAYRDLSFYFNSDIEPILQVLVGRNENAAKEAADQWGWKETETDWKRVVERDDIDIIDIVSPNHSHHEIALAAAKNGKHVLCEKPLAMNVAEAEEMLQEARKSGIAHMICFNYRYVPAVAYIKSLIDREVLGKLYHIRGTFLQDWIMDPSFPLVWRLRKEICGSGSLGDLMAHTIDLARYLVGEFDELSGMMHTFIKKRPLGEMSKGLEALTKGDAYGEVDVDDAVAVISRFQNGCMGVLEASRFAKGNRCGNRLEINGSKGSIRWDMENMNNLHLYLEDDPAGMQGFRLINCTEAEHPYTANYWPAGHIIGYEHTFTNLIFEFFQAIASGSNPSPDFLDGLKCQKILAAIEESSSAKTWKAVK